MKMRLLSLLTALCFAFSPVSGEIPKDIENYKLSLLFPVNWTKEPKVNLLVAIPANYKSIQPPETWLNLNQVEFIPNGESNFGWTSIITVNKFVGEHTSASAYTSKVKAFVMSQASDVKFMEDSNSKETDYESSKFVLAYTFGGKREVLGARYYSGNYDCSGVQYTIRLKKGESDQEAYKKITDFFNSNVSIVE